MAESIENFVACVTRHAELSEAARHPDKSEPGWMQRHLAALDDVDTALGSYRGIKSEGLSPLYWSCDDGEICGAFAQGEVDLRGFALGLLNVITERALDDAPIEPRYGGSFRLLVEDYGIAVVPMVLAVAADALKSTRIAWVRYEDRSWPTDEDGEEIVGDGEPPLRVAPIDTDDDDWGERGFTDCSPADEHAKPITRCDVDDDLIQPLRELIEQRGKAAKVVLRGEATHA